MAGRKCTICGLPNRGQIERDLIAGESITRISAQLGISSASVYRHVKNHAAPQLREALAVSPEMNTPDLISRVADIANGARALRLQALDAGQTVGAIKAGDSELRALTVLTDRLGVDSLDVLDNLRSGELLAEVVGQLARRDSNFRDALVRALRLAGADELADALDRLTSPTERKAIS